MNTLETIEVETKPNPEWAVIWLHGLGADGNDFVPVVPELGLADAPGVRFIFPHSDMIPVTCNNGYVMRAWYDILELNAISRKVDEAGIRKSRDAVRALIKRENQRGISTQHIFLAGFSQGGAMVYSTGLTHSDTLAGLIALSTYVPSADLINTETHPANSSTPLFAAHGLQDPVVPFALGEAAKNQFSQPSRTVDWHSYKMQHSVCIEEIEAIGKWIKAIIQK